MSKIYNLENRPQQAWMHNHHRIALALAAAAFAGTARLALGAGLASAQLQEDPAVQQLAVAYYASKHHVDSLQAETSIAIQDQSAGIEDDLMHLLGAQYAGVWYDADKNGRLQIGMTPAAEAQADAVRRIAIDHGVATYTDLVPVRYAEAELQRSQAAIRSSIADMIDSAHAKTGYNTRTNTVVVTAIAKLPASEEARIQGVAKMAGVSLRRINLSALNFVFDSCSITACDPPFRGGRMISPGGGGCTAAFIARDRSIFDQWWALTAGHCVYFGGTSWSAKNEAGASFGLGNTAYDAFAGGPGFDAAIVSIDWNGFWLTPTPLAAVVVKASSATTYDPTYAIQHTSYTSIGQTLCRTGWASGSECGEVSELGDDETGRGADGKSYTVKNMAELDMCGSKPGDSGGPIYKIHNAYGIFSGSTSAKPFSCFEAYQLIHGAEDVLNVSTLTQ